MGKKQTEETGSGSSAGGARKRKGGPSRSLPSTRQTVAILKAQQEATLDGILVVDSSGKVLSYNRRFLEIWRIPSEVAEQGTDQALLDQAFALVANWDTFIHRVEYHYEHPGETHADEEIELKDGRMLSRSTVPVTGDDGSILGRAWYFRDVTGAMRSEKLQSALFRIAEVSRASSDLDELYASIHAIVGELMDARNFYIALYDSTTAKIRYPYFVDVIDTKPDLEQDPGTGLTSLVLRTGQPFLVKPADFERLLAEGQIDDVGAASFDWIGVPLNAGTKTFGVLSVQTYDEHVRYSERDKDLLVFVSRQVASAIDQKRKEDALKESENRYRQMFENNAAIMLVIDPDTGVVTDANKAASDFYGYSREEMLSKKIWDFNTLPPETVASKMKLAATEEQRSFFFQHRLANGEIRDVEVHSGPIDVRGHTMLYSILHDVTERKSAERSLASANAQRKAVLDAATHMSIIATDPQGIITVFNRGAESMLGYTADEMIGQQSPLILHSLFELDGYARELGEETGNTLSGFEALVEKARGGAIEEREWTYVKKDGTALVAGQSITALRNERGVINGFLLVARDLTERKRSETTLRVQSAAINASIDGVAIVNKDGDYTYVNDAFVKLYGYRDASEIVGHKWTMAHGMKERLRFFNEILPRLNERGEWRGEAVGRKRNGTTFPEEVSLTTVEGVGFVGVVRDITERTYAEEQIKHLAYHDALTGLPNRLLFKDRLSVALAQSQREQRKLAILFLDLDRFKVVNDSLGHNVGDHLLQLVGARLQSCVRESDTVSRLGGDEFTILLPAIQRPEDAAKIAEKILNIIQLPIVIDERELYVTTSVGISLYPDDGTDPETLIKSADTAMYQAKEEGRNNFQLFNAKINARAVERLSLEHGLRRAVANQEFTLYYQPICDLRTGRVDGVEALIRWQHPESGLLTPAHFITVAESMGLLVPIGNWVLETACRQLKQWRDKGYMPLTLAVNLAVSQIQQSDLVDRVRAAVSQTCVEPGLVELEITESNAMLSPEASLLVIQELKKLGVRVSLDDFGIGHSSLAYLRRFPIDTLKIDQSFIQDLSDDPDTANIITAIIAMGHSLRLKVIAEGVETEAQKTFLIDNGCDQMQGFLFRRPMPPEEFEALLLEDPSRAAKAELTTSVGGE